MLSRLFNQVSAKMGTFRTPHAVFPSVLDLLFPRNVKCGLCGIALGEDFPYNLCPACTEGLAPIGVHACRGCGRYVGAFAPEGRCSHCLGDSPGFSAGVSVFLYNDAAQDLVHGLKYHGSPWLAHSMGAMMGEAVRDLCRSQRVQCLVPVPIHRQRTRERGYNQASLLADALAKQDGVPGSLEILIRTRDTLPQNQLSRKERGENVKSAFAIASQWQQASLPERILLVDDVLTTGNTADACAKALLKGGVKWVGIATFASVGN